MNKKNFVINKKSYTIVIGHRNYLEFKEQHRASGHYTRRRICKGLQAAQTLEELEELALPIIAALQNKPTEELIPSSVLHAYLIENEYRYKPRTYKQFTGVASRFVAWCKLHKYKPAFISNDQAKKYILEVSVGRNKNTLANIVLVLKTIYNGLLKNEVVKINPFASIEKIKRSPVSLMYFNDLQIKAIKDELTASNTQLLLAIELLFNCFIRPAELRLLQLYDVNLQDNFIEIKGEISKNGKTQKVILSPSLAGKLSKLISNFPLSYYIFSKSGAPGAVPVSVNYFNKQHFELLKKLKIRGRYALYSWKHTGVVKMVRAGVHVKDIQLQLRHSSLDMVDEYLKNLGVMDSTDLKNKMPIL